MTGIDDTVTEIADEFALLPDWEERISYVIELARGLEALKDAERTEQNRVRGCASQVWLVSRLEKGADGKGVVLFEGESDAMIVRGLIAVLLQLYSGKTPGEILAIDAKNILGQLGLDTHLSQQRSNGLFSMVERIRSDARIFAAAGA